MDLLVGRGPVEVAVLVGDVAVQRSDRRVDQLGHGELLTFRVRPEAQRLCRRQPSMRRSGRWPCPAWRTRRAGATVPTVTAPNASDRHSRGSANGLAAGAAPGGRAAAKAQERARIAREWHHVVAHPGRADGPARRSATGASGSRSPSATPGRRAGPTRAWPKKKKKKKPRADGGFEVSASEYPAEGPGADLRSGQEDQGRAGRRRAAGPLGAAHDPRVGRRHRGRRGSRRRRRGGGAGRAARARGGAHGHPHAGHGRPGRDQGAHRPARPAKDHHADHLRTGRVRPHGAGERRCRVPPEGHPCPATSSRPSTRWPRATPRSPSSCS